MESVFRKNRVTQILNIQYPVIEGGMAYIGDGRLAAAVSETGGFGQIGCAGRSIEDLSRQIEAARSLTSKPFGINLPIGQYADPSDRIRVILEHQHLVKAVSISAGNPLPYIQLFKNNGLIVLTVVASKKQALKVQEAGADIVIAEGYEAGGHNGIHELTTFSLIPEISDSLQIPVVAAGGIVNGKGMLAAMVLGAEAVQLGTRFIATHESPAHPNYKMKIVESTGEDTLILERSIGRVARVFKSPYIESVLQIEQTIRMKEELYPFIKGEKNRLAALDGELEKGFVYASQATGQITSIMAVTEVIDEIIREYTERLGKFCR